MEGDHFNYHFADSAEAPDIESSSHQRYTVDKGINSARAATFVVEGLDDAFIDLSKCYVKSRYRILNADGAELDEASEVFFGPHHSSNLWSNVSVSLNNTYLPPGNDHAYTALMIDLLGASPQVRDGVFEPLGGWSNPHHDSSKISASSPDEFEDYMPVGARSKIVTSYHRIHSDFLQSCSQLLPNRMQLGVTLTRGKDSFVLCRRGADLSEYKIDVVDVSLFVKRVRPNPLALPLLNERLLGGGKLHYQRLQILPFPCAKDSRTWNWHNCFNNTLPRRVFVALVTQEAYFGNYNRLSTFLESMSVSRVRFCLNGRDIMAEPYTFDFKYKSDGVVDWDGSDAKSGYAGLNRAIGVFSTPRQHVGVSYLDYVNGATIFGVSLDHGDGLKTVKGSLDVHMEFAKGVSEPLMVLVLGEYPRTLTFDANRSITEM